MRREEGVGGSAVVGMRSGKASGGRRSHGGEQARRDRDVLEWVARFRFVTAEITATRFEVSVQRMRRRLRRLAVDGLIEGHRASVAEPLAYFLTRRGRLELGLAPRKPPRPDAHRRHELAIVRLVALLELSGSRVLTERECRWAEARERAARYSVDTPAGRRWPDAVLVAPDGRRLALEIEFASKPTARLRAIARGYLGGSFDCVRVLVESPRLADRMAATFQAIRRAELAPLGGVGTVPELEVLPWIDVDDLTRAAILHRVQLARDRVAGPAAALRAAESPRSPASQIAS